MRKYKGPVMGVTLLGGVVPIDQRLVRLMYCDERVVHLMHRDKRVVRLMRSITLKKRRRTLKGATRQNQCPPPPACSTACSSLPVAGRQAPQRQALQTRLGIWRYFHSIRGVPLIPGLVPTAFF